MKKLSESQAGLLWSVKMNPGLNTHQIAQIRGDAQRYESYLLTWLIRLEQRGLIYRVEDTVNGRVKSRVWFPAQEGGDSDA